MTLNGVMAVILRHSLSVNLVHLGSITSQWLKLIPSLSATEYLLQKCSAKNLVFGNI